MRNFFQNTWELFSNIDPKISQLWSNDKLEIGYSAIRHHFGYAEGLKPKTVIDYIIGQADNLDSTEDRLPFKTYWREKTRSIGSPFGNVQVEKENCTEARKNIYDRIKKSESIEKIRKELLDMHRKDFSTIGMRSVPAMGVVPDNDTTLWDHCFSTASIAKVILNGLLLNSDQIEILKKIKDQKLKVEEEWVYLILNDSPLDNDMEIIAEGDYRGRNEKVRSFKVVKSRKKLRQDEKRFIINKQKKYSAEKFTQYINIFQTYTGTKKTEYENINLLDCLIGAPRIFAIQFPGRDFLTDIYRLPDFIARDNILRAIKDEIIQIIEEELNLGNCIFQDVNGIYFLIPELCNNHEIEIEVKRKIRQVFSKHTVDYLNPFFNSESVTCQRYGFYFGDVLVKLRKQYEDSLEKENQNGLF